LAAEQRTRAEVARKATSRHSRFGTTISVSLNTNKKQGESTTTEPTNPRDSIHGSKRAVLLHRQSAVAKDAGGIMDLTKKTGVKKIRTTDELSREENLSVEAKTLLQNLAIEMLDACFNREFFL
jgi:replication fork protection complex subunit Tof1/Swi1